MIYFQDLKVGERFEFDYPSGHGDAWKKDGPRQATRVGCGRVDDEVCLRVEVRRLPAEAVS